MQCRNIAVADGIGVINYKKDNREVKAGRQHTENADEMNANLQFLKQRKTFKSKVTTSFKLIYILSFTRTNTATFTISTQTFHAEAEPYSSIKKISDLL